MKKLSSLSLRLTLACLMVVLACSPVVAVEMVDLGARIVPYDINNDGVVVGIRKLDRYMTTAFRYSPTTGQVEDLEGTAAYAVNDAGQIVGSTLLGAFMLDGEVLQTWDDLTVKGINALGQLAGSRAGKNPYRPVPVPFHPAIYDDGEWTTIDIARTYPRGRRPGVYADIFELGDINDAGVAVGSRRTYGLTGSSALVIAPADTGVDGAVEVTYLPISGGVATGINNNSMIVGTTGVRANAFIYDGIAVTRLGTLPGGHYSSGRDINDAGTVVGSSGTSTIEHAFVKELFGTMQDLNDLVNDSQWVLMSASAINEHGDIVGTGILNGQPHGFLLRMGD